MKTTLFAAALGLAFAPSLADAQPIRRGFPGVRGGFSDCGPVVIRRRPPVRDCWIRRRPPIRDCWTPRRPPIRDCWTPRRPIVRPRGPIFDRGFDRRFDRGIDCRNGNCNLDRGPIFRRNPRDLGPGVRVVPRSFGRDIRRDVDREIRDRGRRDHDHGPRLLPPRP